MCVTLSTAKMCLNTSRVFKLGVVVMETMFVTESLDHAGMMFQGYSAVTCCIEKKLIEDPFIRNRSLCFFTSVYCLATLTPCGQMISKRFFSLLPGVIRLTGKQNLASHLN
jgi:hypothetical protein